jgi:hypothetical protein
MKNNNKTALDLYTSALSAYTNYSEGSKKMLNGEHLPPHMRATNAEEYALKVVLAALDNVLIQHDIKPRFRDTFEDINFQVNSRVNFFITGKELEAE